MKIKYLSTMPIRIVFVLALLMSHHVFASQQVTVLNATDSNVVGQGMFDEATDAIANLELSVQGQKYMGTGIIQNNVGLSTLSKQRQGLRSDRAFLASFSIQHKRHAKVMLVASDGLTLDCELSIHLSELSGRCINPEHQQAFILTPLLGATE